jgi:hypothetical protein
MLMLFVMWEASILVGQLLALQEGSAVGWMTKELPNNFRQGSSLLSSLKHPDNLRDQSSTASYSLHAEGKVGGPGSKPLTSV